ncbi:hypothetical protein FACS189468_5570 [Spirochaetia bacterium]|nr:hypothetical protein FACS189468_5570 [Spirochaetia bacterium]
MKNRGGSVEQVVSRIPLPLIEAQTLNAPKPLICCMAVFNAVYFGRFENCSNGLQTVRGLSGVGVAAAIGRACFGGLPVVIFGDVV